MKRQLMYPLMLVAVVGVACGGDESRRGTQQSYETVEEGSASGVTSTIHGPGEVLPPVTGTNADTTNAFTIDPNAVGNAPAPNTVANGPMTATYSPPPAYPIPQTSASPTPQPPQPLPRPQPIAPPPAPTPEPEPEPEPPTQTDTIAPEESEEEEPPPPPPTTTDTRGQ